MVVSLLEFGEDHQLQPGSHFVHLFDRGKNNYVKKIFSSLGFDDIVVSKDLNKINRVVAGKWTK